MKRLSISEKHFGVYSVSFVRKLSGIVQSFPLAFPTRAIYSILDGRRGLVLDPYAGSGTTLVAAKLLGCDYLGIEISKPYADIARKRILDCEKERRDLNNEVDRHFVRESFSERKKNGKNTGKFRSGVLLRLPERTAGDLFAK